MRTDARRDGARAGRARLIEPPRRAAPCCRLKRPALRQARRVPAVLSTVVRQTASEGSRDASPERAPRRRTERSSVSRPVCRRRRRTSWGRDPFKTEPRPCQAALETFRPRNQRPQTGEVPSRSRASFPRSSSMRLLPNTGIRSDSRSHRTALPKPIPAAAPLPKRSGSHGLAGRTFPRSLALGLGARPV
jgi:hypothetical protein